MDNTHTFWDHLEALRWSIIRSLGVVLLFFVAAFIVVPHIFDEVVLAAAKGVEIINLNLTTQFLTHMRVAFWLAVTAAFPYIIYEAWRFISPALYSSERRHIRFAFTFGTAMFYAGCATGYAIVFPVTFRFLAHYTLSESIANSISLESYMGTLLTMIFTMGIMFELPLLTWALSQIGILKKRQLQEYRRHAIVTLLILSAVITPTGDPFTLLIVFLPLYLLYETGILLSKR